VIDMRVLVTGASGFVGLNVIKALCEAGHEAHAYVRASSNVSYLATMPARLHTGELGDRARLDAAMRGVDAVIHCAGSVSHDESNYALLRAANVEGTRAVVDAAVDAGVSRFVHTSTTWTIGAQDDPARQWREDTPLTGVRAESLYARTKAEGESIVRAAVVRGLDSVVLNPAEVIGAWDHTLNGWGRMILAVAAERIPFVPPGTGSFCLASEVGRAHVAALTRGDVGARYILAGADATYAHLLETVAAVAGVTPGPPLRNYAQYERFVAERTAQPPSDEEAIFGGPRRLRILAGHYRFDASRAVRDLGYRLTPLVDMVREAHAWFRAHGFLPWRA
jgi:dihydroflavonol-4-reductase